VFDAGRAAQAQGGEEGEEGTQGDTPLRIADVQIVENWSRISGIVESFEVPELPEADGWVTVRVDKVSDVSSKGTHYRNLLKDAKGTEVRIRVPAEAIRRLKAKSGEKIEIDVRRGRSPSALFAHPDLKVPK
jgi:hypothetical protein